MSCLHKSIINIVSKLKWTMIGVLIGVIGGLLGTLFHISVDFVTTLRVNNPYLILFLPLGGLVIAVMYNAFRSKGNIDTKRVFQSVKDNKDIPVVMIPLIFIGTVITHLLGGSAGREGAALQLGGSMGYNLAKILKRDKDSTKLIVTAGMSSVFAALFGTPFAATVFSLEVTRERMFNLGGIFIGLLSSVTAFVVSQTFSVAPVRFEMLEGFKYQADIVLKVFVLAVLCAGVCIIFATSIKKMEYLMEKYISNCYVRPVIGGLIIVFLTVVLKTTDYNGAGMDIIKRAISGDVRNSAFLIKILFTAITVAAGFKGGEIVPTFFIGATFGCFMGKMIGIDEGLGASLGLVSMFSGMTKCPIAAFLLSLEVFGTRGTPLFAIAAIITYIFSGNFGLYENTNFYTKFLLKKTNNYGKSI